MTSAFPRWWLAAAVIAIVASLSAAFVPVNTWTALALFNVPVGIAVAAAVAAARRHWRGRRAPWLALAVATGGFFLGEMIWWVYTARGVAPYPSAADIVFLAAYLPLGLTAVLLVQSPRDPDRSSWIDAGVLGLIASLGIWVAIISPAAAAPEDGLAAQLFTLAYPICDLLVIALVLRLVLHRGAKTPASVVFTLGVMLTLVGDLTFTWMHLRGVYEAGSLVDAVWLAGYLTLGLAGLMPGADAPPRREAEDFGLERGRLALVLGAVLVPFGVLAAEFAVLDMLGSNTATVALAVAAGVVGLVAVRLWGLLGRARRVEQRRGEERLSALIHHSTEAIMLVAPDRTVTFASPAASDIWGGVPENILERDVLDLVASDARHELQKVLDEAQTATIDAPLPVSVHTRSAADRVCIIEGTLRNLTEDPSVGAYVLTVRDVTRRREMEAELEHRAFHDALTGLANRALFLDRAQHAIDRWHRSRDQFTAVLYIDLDDFKALNDGMGHGAGDDLLIEVANRLHAAGRRDDTVARLGGDEFALLLEGLTAPESAVLLAEQVLESLRRPVMVMDVAITIPASVGIAFVSTGCTVESLLRDADIAMYSAKSDGKDKVAVFGEELLAIAHRRLALKVALPEALERGQFSLAYQPLHSAVSGNMIGVEALIRWQHPELGHVSPAEIIPHAEDSGLIVDIGRWVLNEACRQAAAWNARSATPLTVNVNVSGVQLRDGKFVAHVLTALSAHDLDPELLTLEITESVLVESLSSADVLDQLRATGVRLAIDDFGTGYSSLAYLHRLPVASLKIDRVFVTEPSEGRDDALVRSIVALAHALDLSTIAEGVETAEQARILADLSCDVLQGYHLGRPQPAADIDALIDAMPAPAGDAPER